MMRTKITANIQISFNTALGIVQESGLPYSEFIHSNSSFPSLDNSGFYGQIIVEGNLENQLEGVEDIAIQLAPIVGKKSGS